MKFQITMKDPDGVWECVNDAARDSVRAMDGLSEDETEELIESRRDGLFEDISRWFEYGEYVTVEVDTDANTAAVIPNE